ncbi:MAG: branched-chain amino acid aminotransferase [Rickettsiaceae bacterium]|nr:branched-chain amino acid aminotransferase [Rickettsiaceae bacterium]
MNIIALDQLSGKIWFNGHFIDWSEAKLHFLTHSLHYGTSVFEGERAYNGKIFKLREHTERLFKSAETYGLKIPFSLEEIMKASQDCLTMNNITEAYVRPLVWFGSDNVWISTKDHTVNVMIAAWCPPSYLTPAPKKRLNVHISRWVKPSADMFPVNCKSAANYPLLTKSKNEALDEGFDDAILLDSRGYITECTTSNIFFCRDGELFTPTPDCFLNGITRQTVIEIARELNIKCTEQHLSLEDIKSMDECFITGTACEVQGIASLTFKDKCKLAFKKLDITDTIYNRYKTLTTAI